MGKLATKYLLCALLAAALAGSGCFSIPFLGGGGAPTAFEPQKQEFDRANVFVGYDGDGRPIVEIRLIEQEVTAEKGLVLKTRIFTTENFKVVNIFRGLRSINYYPIERRFHRLELKYGRDGIKMKVAENLQIKGDKPIDAIFEHTGEYSLLPDTIEAFKLKFQDVDRWGKLPADTLDAWYAAKEQYFQIAERRQQRSSLVESYRRAQEDDYTKTFTQYDSLYVTTNNAYVYLEKDVSTDILYTLSAGDQVDYGVSDGVWVEIPTPDSLKPELIELFEKRQQAAILRRDTQRRMARSARGGARIAETEVDTTLRLTGYLLDVMAQKREEEAIAWEKFSMQPPVDVPLFAKVLTDRELARVARRDSIEKAYQDSVKATADSIAAVAAADSVTADSIAAAAPAAQAGAQAASAATAAQAGAADTTAQATPPAGTGSAAQPATADSSRQAGRRGRGGSGTDIGEWTGDGPPPWAGIGREAWEAQQRAKASQAPPADSNSSSGAAPADSTSSTPPDSVPADSGQAPAANP